MQIPSGVLLVIIGLALGYFGYSLLALIVIVVGVIRLLRLA